MKKIKWKEIWNIVFEISGLFLVVAIGYILLFILNLTTPKTKIQY
jgi:cytochrome bd-type quinol oxidase subunit 2